MLPVMGCACSGQYESAGHWQDGMGVLLSAQACRGESADPRGECSAAVGGHQCMESARTSQRMSALPVWKASRRMSFLSARTAMRCMLSLVCVDGSTACAPFHICVDGSAAWRGGKEKNSLKTVYRVGGTMDVEENDGLAVQRFRCRRLWGAGCTVKWLGSMAMCTAR